jgi:diguanylate cyclase (GGDEF)-like protein/PAS domain S-box-containing protein
MNKRHLFYSLPVILLLIVAVAGWLVTDYLGNKFREEIIGEIRASTLTLHVYVSDALSNLEGAVKALAGSPWIDPALLSIGNQHIEHANSALDRYNSAMNASVSYLMDADGMTVASSNRKDPDSFVGKSYHFRPYFQEAAKGKPGRYFALGMTSGKRGFYASYPVQNLPGKVIGVVTMKKDLDDMEIFFSQHPFCFFISPEGIIFLSSTPAMVLKSLWPLDKTAQEKLIASQQFGNKLSGAVLFKKEIADGIEVTLEGKDYFVSRKVIDSAGWSIVLLTPTDRVWNYKLIGILITISVCFLIVILSGVIYVTERSRAAIRQSEKLYKVLAEKSMAGVYVTQDGKFRFINSNAASYAGYTREELLNQEADLLVSPEDREKARQNARAMLLGEMRSPYEFRIITKQGETRWIMETVTSILHEGRPAVLGNSMNITEHKYMEDTLKESENRLLSITEGSPIPAFVIGKDHRILYWNRALEKLSQIPAEEVIGTTHQWRAFYNTERPCMADLLVDEVIDKIPQLYEGKYIKSSLIDGAYEATDFFPDLGEKGLWLHFTTVTILDSHGNLFGAMETLEDITDRKQVEETMRESESKFRTFFESANDAIFLMDQNIFIDCNPKTLEMFGCTREQIIGQPPYRFSPEVQPDGKKSMEKAQEKMETALRGQKQFFEWKHSRYDGTLFDAEVSLNNYSTAGKDYLQATVRDITDRNRAEEARRDSELKYRTLVENTHDFVFMVDRNGLFTYVNPNLENITGYSLSDLKGQPFTFVIAPDEKKAIIDRFRKGIRVDASLPYETELINKEGKRVAVEFLTSNLCDSTGDVTGRFGVGRDITKRKESEALLQESESRYRELSIIDDLTQLYNSRYFYHQLKMEIDRVDRYGQPLTLLLLDLDDFKRFNDTYGHIEGDQVLMRFGQVVKRCLRQTDSAYRYGGEEFTILMPMTTSKNGAVTAERIRAELEEEIFSPVSGKDVYITVSIGLAQYKSQEDMKAFVNRVDQLMYQAKKNGKDRVCSES